jgi:hypothetical protein
MACTNKRITFKDRIAKVRSMYDLCAEAARVSSILLFLVAAIPQ